MASRKVLEIQEDTIHLPKYSDFKNYGLSAYVFFWVYQKRLSRYWSEKAADPRMLSRRKQDTKSNVGSGALFLIIISRDLLAVQS